MMNNSTKQQAKTPGYKSQKIQKWPIAIKRCSTSLATEKSKAN